MKYLLLTSLSMLALGACSQNAPAPMPPVDDAASMAPMAQPLPLEPLDAAVAMPPPAVASAPMAEPAMTAPQPLTPPPTMAVPIDDRLAKLEEAVTSLKADYARMAPAFASLNATNARVSALLDEVERENAGGKRAAPVSVQEQKPAKPDVGPAVKSSGKNEVKGLRIGEHGDKTRLVLDLTGTAKPAYSVDLDKGEKLLLIDLPKSAWAGKISGKPVSPLIDAWKVSRDSTDGVALAVQLKKDAHVLSTKFMPAGGKDPARLVVDIAAGD